MQPLLLVMVVAASATYADSSTSVSCTFGTTTQTGTTNCNVPLRYGQVSATAIVFERVHGNQYEVDAEAYVGEVADHGGPAYGATANANDSLELGSGGSKRAGFIQFAIENAFSSAPLPSQNTPTATELFTDGVHRYSYQNSTGSTPGECNRYGCEFLETLPFDLGSPFDMSISAEAAIGNGFAELEDEADGSPQITFSLLESDGKTSVPLFLTPEPSTWGLFLFGLLVCSGLTVKRDQTRLRRSH